jgi:2-polyprenyl-3-methyl-5-hydroxy-6-metoxy-1,4-benzoquinol methylase
MEIPNVFSTGGKRSDRVKKLEEIRSKKYLNPSRDFLNYGFDYFDNAQIPSGYRFYVYDGRFEKPVNDLIEAFQLTADMKIADYGCAKGYLLYEFKKKGYKTIGFDKSEYAIREAHAEVKVDIFHCQNPELISDYDFDFLICRNVLPHLDKSAILSLIKKAIENCSCKPYFIIHSFEADENKKDYEYWDRTHITVMKADHWRKFLAPFDEQIYFSLDCLF